MREIVSGFLTQGVSRRSFVNRLLGLGFTLSSAQALLAPLEASERAGRNEAVPSGYAFEGSGGALVAEQARAAGAEYLFTNPGYLEVGLFDALADFLGIQVILGLHEGIVTAMADGYAKVSGKPGFVNVHAIAGPAQMGGQLYNASRDGTPLVVTAGMADNEAWSDEFALAARPGFDAKDVNRQFTKIAWDARQAASLPLMLRRAFKVAATEPGGPVFLAMAHYALESKPVKAQILPAERFLLRERMRPQASAVQEAARLLIEAQRPIAVIGDEIWKSGAQAEMLALSEQLGLAVCDTRTCFSNFPVQHPHYLGMPGDGPNPELMKSEFVQRGVDLVVMIGARDLGGKVVPEAPEMPPEARIVRIGLDASSMGRNYPTDVALIGDIKESLADLHAAVEALMAKERLGALSAARSQEVRAITSAKRALAEAAARANFGRSPLHPDELGAVLARTIDRDAIVVDENFTGRHGALSYGFRENEQMRLATSGGSLGWGIGAATGAKLAAADRQVVCSIGDGAFMYSASGLWTQARYGIPVLTLVSNNSSYQIVRWAEHGYKGRMAGSGHYPCAYLGDPNIDFVRLAASQGVQGERVSAGSELESALKRGIAATRAGKPYLVEIVVARYGNGADSTWHETFNLAERRKRKV
ncbi:MAG: thiamine pyrophosphate-binding protein [Acidobacteriia bacterium]|nr:thiamine pyrophosphate-binding protein [Terriglobia bacterium]